MTVKIGNVTLAHPVAMAPMAGMTDTAFRRLVKRQGGCGLVVTEMVSSEGMVRGIDRTLEYAEYTEEERPVSIQIFGGDPVKMADAAQIVEGMGADIVDINMGCPVPKIAKHHVGCPGSDALHVLGRPCRAARHQAGAWAAKETPQRRIVRGNAEPHAAVPYVWTDQFDLRLAITGEFRADDEMHVCLGTLAEDKFLALFGRGGTLVEAVGCKRPRQLNAARRWIAEGLSFADAIAQAK